MGNKKLWYEYTIKIKSLEELNTFALADICDYIQQMFGYKKRDVMARVIKKRD